MTTLSRLIIKMPVAECFAMTIACFPVTIRVLSDDKLSAVR